jgi:hypothetical protein
MNLTMKTIIPLLIIVLFLSNTIISPIAAETKLINDKKSDLARKHLIYISGEGLEQLNYNNYCFEGPLSFFYRFYGFNGSYVRMFFNITENILMIKDGIPRTIQGPVYLEFGLSDPNTFTFLIK